MQLTLKKPRRGSSLDPTARSASSLAALQTPAAQVWLRRNQLSQPCEHAADGQTTYLASECPQHRVLQAPIKMTMIHALLTRGTRKMQSCMYANLGLIGTTYVIDLRSKHERHQEPMQSITRSCAFEHLQLISRLGARLDICSRPSTTVCHSTCP